MTSIIYDCEIICCIPTKETKEDNFKYCNGWKDFANMGISVICAADLESGKTWSFIHPECREFQKLIYLTQAGNGKIYGFNSINFDDKLCRANGIAIKTDFDLLLEVRKAAYGSSSWQDQPKGYKYSLDAIAKANGYSKTGSGELAPKLWQQGKHQEVIDYCLNDVKITKELILLFLAGKLKDPNNGKILLPT